MRNQSAIASLLLVGMALAATASAADPVYKWVDSSGHSHYSQSPPPQGQRYQTITPAGGVSEMTAATPPATGAATPTAAKSSTDSNPTPAEIARQKMCETARNNVQVLTNQPVVEQDIYATGKPQRLTPAQQAEQLTKAKQQVEALCAK